MFNFIKNIGLGELIVIGIIIIVFFGSKKIVELGRAAGETTKEFKKIKDDFKDAKDSVEKDEETEEKEQE